MGIRFAVYGALGMCAEVLFTAVAGLWRKPAPERWRLDGHTQLWVFPLYGLAALAFEPLHDAVRGWAMPARAGLYAAGILGVEYVAGRVLGRILGKCPWDYGKAPLAVHGVIRLDYAPLWGALGLVMELVHDWLDAMG